MLAVLERVLLLEDVEVFEPLDGSAMLAVANAASIECFSEEMVVCARGNRDDRLFVLVSGEVRIERGDRDIAVLRPYDCFGELSLFGGTTEPLRAVSVGDVISLSVTRADLHRALAERPVLANAVLEAVTHHLRTRLQLPLALAATSA